MKKAMIALLIIVSASPVLAADKGPSKKALSAMAQSERDSCALDYLSFARASRKGTEMSVTRDKLPSDEAKMHGKASDAFQLRGLQFLNADAKMTDAFPKAIDDAATASVDRMLADPQAFQKNWDAIGSCNTAAGIERVDMEAIMAGK